MSEKKSDISADLLIHPGETIEDILEERGISQVELAVQAGVPCDYVDNIIAGTKDISESFAVVLESILGISKSFWVNLQKKYDEESNQYSEH